MGGRCDRPDAAAGDYRLTYRSSQMVRTGAAKTKQCCEHMISATTTRELSTGLDESAGKTHIAWTSDRNRRCRRFRSGGHSARTYDAAGAERDGGIVDARSPLPGAATERAELWLEGNSYSPLPSRLRWSWTPDPASRPVRRRAGPTRASVMTRSCSGGRSCRGSRA